MSEKPRQTPVWELLDQLSAKARQAESEQELLFSVANDGFALAPYRSALVFTVRSGTARLAVASGLHDVDRRSPFGAWSERVISHWLKQGWLHERKQFTAADVDADLAAVWAEYWPATVHVHALTGRESSVQGVVVYITDHAWPPGINGILSALHQVQGLCLQQIHLRPNGWGRVKSIVLGNSAKARRRRIYILVLLLLVLFVPIKQFVIAPADIISLDTITVTTPVEGIVAEMVAKPNQPVKSGDVLIRLDDTAIRNRLASARQGLEVARAEYLAGAHRALVSTENGGEGGVLKGRIHERLAEVAYLEEQLAMMDIKANRDGIAVYGQENDWIGKPVSAGQRIMELADDRQVGVNVWVPVADAINMAAGQQIHVLLYADPLHPLQATIEQASYHPSKSPDGVMAYRVRATLPADQVVRLGLRGSAKINGQWVPLGYFLLRRPLSTVRQWMGI